MLDGVFRGMLIETISPIATANPETKVTTVPKVFGFPFMALADPLIANKLVLGAMEETLEGNSIEKLVKMGIGIVLVKVRTMVVVV